MFINKKQSLLCFVSVFLCRNLMSQERNLNFYLLKNPFSLFPTLNLKCLFTTFWIWGLLFATSCWNSIGSSRQTLHILGSAQLTWTAVVSKIIDATTLFLYNSEGTFSFRLDTLDFIYRKNLFQKSNSYIFLVAIEPGRYSKVVLGNMLGWIFIFINFINEILWRNINSIVSCRIHYSKYAEDHSESY